MLPWHNRRRAYKRGAWLTAIVAAAWIAGNLVDSSAGEIPEHAHLSAAWLIALPAEIIKLYLEPLPWENAESATVVTWYATGALIIYFAIRRWRHSPSAVQRMSACAAMLWIATACFFGGDCWRQALAFLPWMIPGATEAMTSAGTARRRFAIYLVSYTAALAMALAIAYTYR